MKEIRRWRHHIFAGCVAVGSVLVNLAIITLMRHLGIGEKYWGVWQFLAFLTPVTVGVRSGIPSGERSYLKYAFKAFSVNTVIWVATSMIFTMLMDW